MDRSNLYNLYYLALFGALGGLLAWRLTSLHLVISGFNIYTRDLILGVILGIVIGGTLFTAEGMSGRSIRRAVKTGVIGAALGGLGGAVGLPAGEWLFQLVGGSFIGRAIGWAIFGIFIGIAASVTGGTQAPKGAIGGLIGGAVGGLVVEGIGGGKIGGPYGDALGLVLLGACVALAVATITTLLGQSWIEVTEGPMEGKIFFLDKYLSKSGNPASIGSDPWKSDIYLGGDRGIGPHHAQVERIGETNRITDLGVPGGTSANGRPISSHTLSDLDSLTIGETRLLYRERRRVSS